MFAGLCGFGIMSLMAWGQLPADVMRVEEDWEAILNEPDGHLDSPQFHTVMSPFVNIDSYFAQVMWNYRETPEFRAGGVQLQSWSGDVRTQRRSIEYGRLNTTSEMVTWTQALETDGAILSFEVTNGQSISWGAFGNDLHIDDNANIANLNTYNPDVSADNSCVTYGNNRIELLRIKAVRYYDADDNLMYTDTTSRVVEE